MAFQQKRSQIETFSYFIYNINELPKGTDLPKGNVPNGNQR